MTGYTGTPFTYQPKGRNSPKYEQARALKHSELWLAGKAAVIKIGTQFPECAEGRLCLAVISTAIHDLIRGGAIHKSTAYWFLSGAIWPAQLCGVDPDWIRHVLKKLRICNFDVILPAPIPAKRVYLGPAERARLDHTPTAKRILYGNQWPESIKGLTNTMA